MNQSIETKLQFYESLRKEHQDIVDRLLKKTTFDCENAEDHENCLRKCFKYLIKVKDFNFLLKRFAATDSFKIKVILNKSSNGIQINDLTLIITNLLDFDDATIHTLIARNISFLLRKYELTNQEITYPSFKTEATQKYKQSSEPHCSR